VTNISENTTLLGLLDWTFRAQKAHLGGEEGFGLRLGSPRDSCAKLEEIGALVGCRIDGGEWREIGHRVHSDAMAVIETIGILPDMPRALVWQYAIAGTMPDWGETCRFWPVVRDNGKEAVDTHDVVIVDRFGRATTVVAAYCPVTMFPNVEYCREEWTMWFRGLRILKAILPPMKRWTVTSIGVDERPWDQHIRLDMAAGY